MRKLNKEELKKVLDLHKKWLNSKEGIRANLNGADLSHSTLSGSDLRYAKLSDANLNGADLRYANLRYANLSDVDLIGADLIDADLRYANLSDANLRYAKLNGAKLNGADLTNIKYNFLSIGLNLVCPEKGSYIGYKKAKHKEENVIVELLITEDSLRSSATTRKCRCSKAKVLSITSLDGEKSYNKAYSKRDKNFIYRVGEIVEVKDFDINRWNECSTGIHHFITRNEAIEY